MPSSCGGRPQHYLVGGDGRSGDVFRRSAHLGVQFLLHVRAVGCSQKVVEHDERVTLQIEGQVVAATREKGFTGKLHFESPSS